MEKVIVKMDTKGLAHPGFDFSIIEEDISTEIEGYSRKIGADLTKNKIPSPKGSQGEGSTEWIIDQLKDPEMAKLYAGILIFGLNRILTSIKDRKSIKKGKNKEKEQKKKENAIVEVQAFNKSILLPTATLVIKEFLESIGAK